MAPEKTKPAAVAWGGLKWVMDDLWLRALAGALGVLFWAYFWALSDRIAERRARRLGNWPKQPSQHVYRLGVKFCTAARSLKAEIGLMTKSLMYGAPFTVPPIFPSRLATIAPVLELFTADPAGCCWI
jgi:hypothetical protein